MLDAVRADQVLRDDFEIALRLPMRKPALRRHWQVNRYRDAIRRSRGKHKASHCLMDAGFLSPESERLRSAPIPGRSHQMAPRPEVTVDHCARRGEPLRMRPTRRREQQTQRFKFPKLMISSGNQMRLRKRNAHNEEQDRTRRHGKEAASTAGPARARSSLACSSVYLVNATQPTRQQFDYLLNHA